MYNIPAFLVGISRIRERRINFGLLACGTIFFFGAAAALILLAAGFIIGRVL